MAQRWILTCDQCGKEIRWEAKPPAHAECYTLHLYKNGQNLIRTSEPGVATSACSTASLRLLLDKAMADAPAVVAPAG